MEDLIDFDAGDENPTFQAPNDLIAIQNEELSQSYVNSKKPKKASKQDQPVEIEDGADLLDFNDSPNQNENLIDIDDEGTEQLDHDSDGDVREDEFGPIEPGQKRIIVKYDDLKFPVNWWDDTPLPEVREMVICACDSIIDSGFELLSPHDGQPISLKKIQNIKGKGETYTIVKAEEKKEYEKLLGDRWRKIVLEVEPLRHIEAQKAIEFMQLGSNLMRHTGKSVPSIRLFQLSSDLKRLIWFSSSKNINESKIDLRNVTNIIIGQKTELFESYPLPQLSHLSFSLYYKINKSKESYLALT